MAKNKENKQTMKKVYCCKKGGKRFGKTCLTNGFRGSNGFCKYASEIHPLDWVNNLITEKDPAKRSKWTNDAFAHTNQFGEEKNIKVNKI